MPESRYIRQSGIINVEDFADNNIVIIGCGAIGSYVATSLAKMGFVKFSLIDFDKVEEHNLPNQFFKEHQIGLSKVTATMHNMKDYNNKCKVKISPFRYKKSDIKDSQIVLCCVDTMKARQKIWEDIKKTKSVQLFIDTRMGGREGQIYITDMTDTEVIKNYEKTLFNDEEAVQERCTERAILYTVLGMSSFVCQQITKALNGEEINNYMMLDFIATQVI